MSKKLSNELKNEKLKSDSKEKCDWSSNDWYWTYQNKVATRQSIIDQN